MEVDNLRQYRALSVRWIEAVHTNQLFDEIRVFDGIAERTGVHVDRDSVRHNSGVCRSMSEMIRKARASGEGCFYLPANLWPADTEKIEINRRWVVMS